MQDDRRFERLETLDNWELENERQDIRGYPLVTESGERLGTIQDLLVDRDHERVAAVRLSDGRDFPVEPLDIRDETVIIKAGAETRGTGTETTEEVIPIVEERLVVGKRDVESGGIRVRSRVVEEPASELVSLRNEHVEVERRPVDQRILNPDAILKDRTIEMSETDEEVVVGKEARVREEVVVRKDVDRNVAQVSGTVRHTEVDVEDLGEADRDGRR